MSEPAADLQKFENWLLDVSSPGWIWHIKFLAANDTAAKSNVHQGGPHLSKGLFHLAFPVLSRRADREENPDLVLPAKVESHG
ncbi:MAG: EcoRII N-terminal effector-binding domain-containing protein, partial [Thermomicrobiales bacterium]